MKVMEDIIDDNNKVNEENSDGEETDFNYNFIQIPWDERTNRSKIFVILLLLAIFVAIMGMVICNFIIHYKNFKFDERFKRDEIYCNLVKADEYPYAARIHSVSSHNLICIGAVISESLVLADEVCTKSGPVRMYAGNIADQRCKKGFSVNTIELIPHKGIASKNLVLLSTHKKMSFCASVIPVGGIVERQPHAFIIGRPLRGERSLARQLVTLDFPENHTSNDLISDSQPDALICVKYFSRCPISSSDLLVQNGALLGLASISVKRRANNKIACFANVIKIKTKLKHLTEAFDFKM